MWHEKPMCVQQCAKHRCQLSYSLGAPAAKAAAPAFLAAAA